MNLQVQIIQSEGEPKFAVMDYNEYKALQEGLESFDTIEDFVDYMYAIKSKNETTSWHSLDEVKRELGL
ncbi:type II toxin-antitoxin system prevent-host-death family antitoxin [Rudanella lutea]|uniref:type II toxin-antitoxin system prevent-host-death family antitoxin n=1 Tax=Rudanella lutea TaxID=451374 RepID=UPI00037AC101|nr:type II toxin-antitoxin system prevent-host-death family antitoxin [Rudanella lutea]